MTTKKADYIWFNGEMVRWEDAKVHVMSHALHYGTSVFAGLFDAPGRSQFVPADQAFTFDFQQNQHDLNLTWQIKDGYYLYRKQIRITPEHAKIADVQLPQGVWHEDEFYGKSEIYRDRLTLPVTINQASAGATLTVTYQGCADAGFCYPPETKTVPLSEVVANNAASQPVSVSQQEQHTAQLPFSALWALLIGIGIAFKIGRASCRERV